MEWFGYAGKNLFVDLSTGKIRIEEADPELLKEFIGGYSVALRMLYDMLEAGTDPLSPENILIFAASPLKQFLRRGLLATINTDDPGVSAIDLRHEFEVAAPAAGLTADEIHQAQRNALEIAFLDDLEKQELMDRYR